MSPLKKIGLISLLIGVMCWIAFNLIGSTVDAQGVLHEPFALIPIGCVNRTVKLSQMTE